MACSLDNFSAVSGVGRRDTHASNRQASMGNSGVDASRRVFRVVKPPGLEIELSGKKD